MKLLVALQPLPTCCNISDDFGLNRLLSLLFLSGDVITPSFLLRVYSLTWLSLLVQRAGASWLSALKAGADEGKA